MVKIPLSRRKIKCSQKATSQGFTVIELAIVLILMSFVVGMFALGYVQYKKTKEFDDTNEALQALSPAIESFFQANGRYPCPSSFSIAPGAAGYGEETDCKDTSQAVGCGPHYCIATRVVGGVTYRVRIGSLPVLALKTESTGMASSNMAGEYAVDGYGQRFLYAVSEKQGTDSYAAENGAIRIETETGRLLYDRADYVIVSAGLNGVGGRSVSGVGSPCTGLGPAEAQNCSNAATFVDGLQNYVQGTDHFDDIVSYRPWLPYYLWDLNRGLSDLNEDAFNVNLSYAGVGVDEPKQRLHILDGDFYALNYWPLSNYTMFGKKYVSAPPAQRMASILGQGRIKMAGQLCAPSTSDPTSEGVCFPSSLIAGTSFPGCGAGYLMAGIENNAPVCSQVLGGSGGGGCNPNAGFYMKGFNYNFASKALQVVCYNPITGVTQ